MIMIKIGENDVIWPAHEVETKIPEKFPNNPGIENKGKSRPEKSRDLTKSRPENPGIENLDPARAWIQVSFWRRFQNQHFEECTW